MGYPITNLTSLTDHEKAVLSKANINSIFDLLLPSTEDIAKRTRLKFDDVERIVQLASLEMIPESTPITDHIQSMGAGIFTSGDGALDKLVGGGIRTGMIWELVGEGAAGKTQLAMQLCLTVQLPKDQGGLSGSACYITSGSVLETRRLAQLIASNPLFNNCTLDDILSSTVSSPEELCFWLRHPVVRLIESSSTPLKLIVIDSMATLFRTTEKTSSKTLFDRSKALGEISMLLHRLATEHDLAVVVVNDVIAVFDEDQDDKGWTHLTYRLQSRWFNRPDDTYQDAKQEAALGLIWANQVNARLFLSRTGRSTTAVDVDDELRSSKRRKIEDGEGGPRHSESILLRRIDVIFSSFSPPDSLDFVLTARGLRTIPRNEWVAKPDVFGGTIDPPAQVDVAPPPDFEVDFDALLEEDDLFLEEIPGLGEGPTAEAS